MPAYSPALLDRVADAMSCAQQYWTRIAPLSSGSGEIGFQLCYDHPETGEECVVFESRSRGEVVDALDVYRTRAVAAAALLAVDYQEGGGESERT